MIHTVATELRDTPRSVTSLELAAMIRDLRASDIIRANGQNPPLKGRTYDRSRPKGSERKVPACQSGPSTYDGAVDLHPAAPVNVGLAIQREMIAIFGDEDVGE